MRKTLIFLLAVLVVPAATTAQAQIKCWKDADGKRVCGDTPPAGAKVTTIKVPSSPAAATKDAAAKSASKGPLTPAEQDQEYRKRQTESKKAEEKAASEQKDADAKRENCERAREMQRTLESGQRIVRTDSKGERYYLDDAQRDQETGKARQIVQQSCG